MGHCISISENVIRQALVPNDPFATVQVKNDKWPSPIRIIVSWHQGQFKDRVVEIWSGHHQIRLLMRPIWSSIWQESCFLSPWSDDIFPIGTDKLSTEKLKLQDTDSRHNGNPSAYTAKPHPPTQNRSHFASFPCNLCFPSQAMSVKT